MKEKSLYLFDLDGVLIDSKNMRTSWNLVNKKFGLKIPLKLFFYLEEILRIF